MVMFIKHNGSFGRRMLKQLLKQDGINVSERRISRIMKEHGLVSKYGRKKGKNVYTSPNTEKYIQENLFAAMSAEEKANSEIWSMDFTEQKVNGKKVYTCGIISVGRKIVVSYCQSRTCTAALAVEAVRKAIEEYGRPDMIMTDRGVQFTSRCFYDTMQM